MRDLNAHQSLCFSPQCFSRMQLLNQQLCSQDLLPSSWSHVSSPCQWNIDIPLHGNAILYRHAENQYAELPVLAPTCWILEVVIPGLTTTAKKRWTNSNQWLFLDPLENCGHKAHGNPKIWRERWIQIIAARLFLPRAEDVGATNQNKRLNNNTDKF